MKIEVTEIVKINSDGNLKALANVILDDVLIVRGFKVLKGKSGLFVGMPQKLTKEGRWYDIVNCVDEAIKRKIEDAILEAYDREHINEY